MSGKMVIELVKFTTLNADGSEAKDAIVTHGFLMRDGTSSDYSRVISSKEITGKSPWEIVQMARESGDVGRDMIESAIDLDDGVEINGHFFTWNDIRPKDRSPA